MLILLHNYFNKTYLIFASQKTKTSEEVFVNQFKINRLYSLLILNALHVIMAQYNLMVAHDL